jgi:hypothetical protein
MLLVTAVVLILNVPTALRVEQVSPIDETYWMDYMLRGAKLQLERPGSPILPETISELCARGTNNGPLPECKQHPVDPKKLYFRGANITGHAPFYFLVTGVVARALRATPIDLPPGDSLITWARILGSVWLLVGLYCGLRVGELLGVSRRLLIVALLFVAATGALYHASTIVNPDVTALPTGAAVLLAGVSWEKRRTSAWWIVVGALAGTLLQLTNIVGILLVLGFLVLRRVFASLDLTTVPERRPWADYAKVVGFSAIALVLGTRGWTQLLAWLEQHVLAPVHTIDITGNPITTSYGNKHIGVQEIFGTNTVFSMLPPFPDVAYPVQRGHSLYGLLERGTEFVAMGALFATLLRDKLTDKLGTLAIAVMVTLLVSPTLITLYDYWSFGTYDQVVPRWGLSVVPALAIVIAASVRTRPARYAFAGLTALLYVAALATLV